MQRGRLASSKRAPTGLPLRIQSIFVDLGLLFAITWAERLQASQCISLIFSINKVYTLYINVLGFVEEQGIARTVSAQLSVHEVPSSIPWGQFTKTSTSVIYKCSYCFETLMATLAYYTCKSFIKLTPCVTSDPCFDSLSFCVTFNKKL